MTLHPNFIGCDVSKDTLDLFDPESSRYRRVANRFEALRDFAEPDAYFTIASLRREGFRHPLEDLGFGEYFYASLLGADPRCPAQRVFGTIVLFNGGGFGRFSITDFLLSQLREYDMVSPEDFIWDLEDRFGVKVPNRWEVTAAVKDSELYYDSVMDKVYRDKSLYLADLED